MDTEIIIPIILLAIIIPVSITSSMISPLHKQIKQLKTDIKNISKELQWHRVDSRLTDRLVIPILHKHREQIAQLKEEISQLHQAADDTENIVIDDNTL